MKSAGLLPFLGWEKLGKRGGLRKLWASQGVLSTGQRMMKARVLASASKHKAEALSLLHGAICQGSHSGWSPSLEKGEWEPVADPCLQESSCAGVPSGEGVACLRGTV